MKERDKRIATFLIAIFIGVVVYCGAITEDPNPSPNIVKAAVPAVIMAGGALVIGLLPMLKEESTSLSQQFIDKK